MKKIMGIFITLVIVAIMATMAFGEEIYPGTRDDAFTKVNEWTTSQGIELYAIYGDVYHDCKWTAVFSIQEAEEQFGKFRTIDELFNLWKKQVYNESNAEINIKKVGEIEGYDIFNVCGKDGKGNYEECWFMIYEDINE